jgi:crotonobetainyl-CoA:carnitine CoA-transferase CaiB-like acyl-CoA transferase
MLLADLGAEVIKLEPLDGDPFRAGTTYGFLGWNRGTRSLALDLRNREGRELFLDIVRRADALVENYRPGVLARLGIDTPALHQANPRLIHTSISGYGTAGPLATRPCFDPIMQARSGLVRAQGGEEPVFHQVAYTDYSTATLAAFGTVAALLARAGDPTCKGERVEASLLASGFLMQAGFFIDYPGRPADPPGAPTVRGTGPFHRAYEVRDGWIFVAARTPGERDRLCSALGIDHPSDGTGDVTGSDSGSAIASWRRRWRATAAELSTKPSPSASPRGLPSSTARPRSRSSTTVVSPPSRAPGSRRSSPTSTSAKTATGGAARTPSSARSCRPAR